MSDSKELGRLEEQQVRSIGSHETPGPGSSAGCLGRGPLALLFLALMFLTVLLVTIVVQVSKLPSSLGQERFSFTKHWNSGEPNNIGEEDCVELFSQG
uniref:Uncharacterized protein n=1 Tax=Propithecus coquereli TaxID=379532 RepID=A0A2K6F890_PROCO